MASTPTALISSLSTSTSSSEKPIDEPLVFSIKVPTRVGRPKLSYSLEGMKLNLSLSPKDPGTLSAPLSLEASVSTAISKDRKKSAKIGIVDWQELLGKTPQAFHAAEVLEAEFSGRKEELNRRQNEYSNQMEAYHRNNPPMAMQQRALMATNIMIQENELQEFDKTFREEYKIRHKQEMDLFVACARQVIEQLAVEEEYCLIQPSEAVLYCHETIDITAKVIAKMQALSLPKKDDSPIKIETDKETKTKKEDDTVVESKLEKESDFMSFTIDIPPQAKNIKFSCAINDLNLSFPLSTEKEAAEFTPIPTLTFSYSRYHRLPVAKPKLHIAPLAI